MKKPEEYKDEREYVEIEGRDGEWYEQRDLISQYERRPKLDMTSLVQFHRLYRSEALKRMEGGEESEVDKNRAKNTNDKYRVYYSEVGCGIEDCVKCQGKKKGEGLPNKIKLIDARPGETTRMTRRKVPATIRFYKGHKEGAKFQYQELQMYTPFRNEQQELENLSDEEISEKWEKMKEHIKNVKNTLMPYLVDVTEARVWAKEMERENQTKDIVLELDAAMEQENLDDWELDVN